MRLRKSIRLLAVLGVLMIFSACSRQPAPVAVDGVLDLRDWHFEQDGTILLSGQWQFYWRTFLSQDDTQSQPDYVNVPGSWAHQSQFDPALPSTGYASYRLRIITDGSDARYALRMPEAQTALRVYVNGDLIAQQGVAGKQTASTLPAWNPRTVTLPAPDSGGEYDLVIEVANYAHRKGGLDESWRLGTETQIQHIRELNLVLAFVTFGCLVTIGVYHITLNVKGIRDRQSWWFGVLCFAIAARVWVIDEIFFSAVFPSVPWIWIPRLDYILIALAVIAFSWYYRTLFPELIAELAPKMVTAISIVFQLAVLITPSMWFTRILPWYQHVMLFGIAYFLFVTVRALYLKKVYALPSLAGFLVVGMLVVNDVLLNNEFANTVYLSQYGIVAFVLVQASVQATRFSSGFRQTEALSVELEKRVAERTEELNRSLAKLRTVNEMLEISQAEALDSRDNAERTMEAALASTHAKTEFMANVSHQLRTPLNAILGFTDLMLMSGEPDDEARATLWRENLEAIQASSYQLSDLVENVLLMTESETGQMGLHPAVMDLWRMLNGLEVQFRTAARNKNLSFSIERASNVPQYVRTDSVKLHRVLKELLTNAIKFTAEGRVQLSIRARRSLPFYLIIEVSDTGSGFSQDEQSAVFDTFRHVNKGDIYKQGLGLGLPLCRRLVRILGGELTYVSQEHRGTVFRFQIPIEVASVEDYAGTEMPELTSLAVESQRDSGVPRRLRRASLYVEGRNIQMPAPDMLPAGWTERMLDALADYNVNTITNLVYEIRNEHQDYAETLLALIAKSDYDTIKALVSSGLSE